MVKLTKDYEKVVPSLLHEYKLEEGRGVFTVHYHSFFERVICFLFKKPRERKIYADAMSTKMLSLVDGKRSIEEITDLLLSDTGERDKEALMQRIALFLGHLHKKRFVELKRP